MTKIPLAVLAVLSTHCGGPARTSTEARVPGPTVTATCAGLEIHGTNLSDTAQVIPSIESESSLGQRHPVGGVYDQVLDASFYVARFGGYFWTVTYLEDDSHQGFSQSGRVSCG